MARIAVVSIDVATSDSRKDVASVTTEPDAVAASCGATSGADMLVYTADTYVTADVPRAFYVAVIYADDF